MGFYDLPKRDRDSLAAKIHQDLLSASKTCTPAGFLQYFQDHDTYIRKNAYIAAGRIYFTNPILQKTMLEMFWDLLDHTDFRIRQTSINAAGEIGKADFGSVIHFFDKGLFDQHHSVRNAVIGSVKKMGEVNHGPVLYWARQYLHHEDKEIRREICHGIELRGRKYPQDILPMLKTLQFDKTARVRNTLVHVLGQIAYKTGCLETVVADLKNWENQDIVIKALEEIIDVHHRYRDFSVLTQAEARAYIQEHFIQYSFPEAQ